MSVHVPEVTVRLFAAEANEAFVNMKLALQSSRCWDCQIPKDTLQGHSNTHTLRYKRKTGVVHVQVSFSNHFDTVFVIKMIM